MQRLGRIVRNRAFQILVSLLLGAGLAKLGVDRGMISTAQQLTPTVLDEVGKTIEQEGK